MLRNEECTDKMSQFREEIIDLISKFDNVRRLRAIRAYLRALLG